MWFITYMFYISITSLLLGILLDHGNQLAGNIRYDIPSTLGIIIFICCMLKITQVIVY